MIFPLPVSHKEKRREEMDNKGDFQFHLNDECMTFSVLYLVVKKQNHTVPSSIPATQEITKFCFHGWN